jgi:AraC-like DNA-binding protein
MKFPGHLRLEQLPLEPGGEWMDESPAWRFVRLSKGEAYWLVATKPRVATAGELMVVAPNLKVDIRASQLGGAVLDAFFFCPGLLCGFFTLAERQFLENQAAQALDPIQFLPSTHPVSQGLAVLGERRHTHYELVQRGELLVLALLLFSQAMPVVEQAEGHSAPAHDRFEQIISHMPDMELIRHSAEELARLCGCTPRHFSRLFRHQFGESPRARQTQLRLLKARALLESSDEKVTQIAADCGYQSLSLFNSLFKRRFGMTPSEWRQTTTKKSPHFPVLISVLALLWAITLSCDGSNTPANYNSLGCRMLGLRGTNQQKSDTTCPDVTQLTHIRHPEFTVCNFRSKDPSVIV